MAPTAPSDSAMRPTLGLLDLEGLGREIWEAEDAQAYVDRLRDEWGSGTT